MAARVWPTSAEGFAVTPYGFMALLADGVRHEARRYTKEEHGAGEPTKLDVKNVEPQSA